MKSVRHTDGQAEAMGEGGGGARIVGAGAAHFPTTTHLAHPHLKLHKGQPGEPSTNIHDCFSHHLSSLQIFNPGAPGQIHIRPSRAQVGFCDHQVIAKNNLY